jgi:hypothetical protein
MEPQDEQPEGEASMADMLHDLDDETLHELADCLHQELEARAAHSDEHNADPGQGPDSAMGKAEESDEDSKEESSEEMSKSEAEVHEKLAKAEEKTKALEDMVSSLKKLVEEVVDRPVTKAVTDINSIKYAAKGEELQKAETNISDADLKKRVYEVSNDRKIMKTLSKKERDTLSDYYMYSNNKPEVLKIIFK